MRSLIDDAEYRAGAAAWNADAPFAAHEHFEAAWRRGDSDRVRAVFQGLVQYAAAWVKLRAGNMRGFASNAAKAAANLAVLEAQGDDALRAWRVAMLAWSAAPSAPPPRLPV